MELDLDWVNSLPVNRSAVERRAKSLQGRRTVKKQWQAAWLLKAVHCIDLTTLSGDDTPGRVLRLCAKAKNPIRPDILAGLGMDPDISRAEFAEDLVGVARGKKHDPLWDAELTGLCVIRAMRPCLEMSQR